MSKILAPRMEPWENNIMYTEVVKYLPAMESRVQSLGQEDSLENGMATHNSILA